MKLWGVYHANGGLLGELAYVIGKVRGTVHCGLCDITHGSSIRPSAAWRDLEARLDVPIVLVHLNERPAALAAATEGRTPCVMLETARGFERLLGPEDLDACQGSVECFEAELLRSLQRR